MSLFLGPIHKIQFNKIKFQEGLYIFLLNEASQRDAEVKKVLYSEIKTLPKGKLEDIVDKTNIHASLQNMINVVEENLAKTVKILLDFNFRFDDIKEYAYEYGRANCIKNELNLEEAYSHISNIILNGMPCDRIQQITDRNEDLISWHDRIDIHESFWVSQNLDGDYFYDIKLQMINGILKDSSIELISDKNDKFILRRKK